MPATITTERFKYLLKDIEGDKTERELCFILGAGASASAGIPTGGQMARMWFDEMPDKIGPVAFDDWKTNELKSEEKKWLKDGDYAQLYSAIYRKRFELDKETGYHSLLDLMKGKNPGKGHIILSQILRYTRHRCVVTTNFDSLIETAVFRYTNTQPLVCGHEAMAQYAKPTKDIPLIVKVHRDLLTDPKSNPVDIDALDKNWTPVLDHIFNQRTPIVIGYGGNDGSLMNYFEQMKKPANFFWCLYKNEKPSKRIESVVEKLGGIFITHNGFDELMRELLIPFSSVQGNLNDIEEDFGSRIGEFKIWLADGNFIPQINLSTALKNKGKKKEAKQLSAWEYKTKADATKDIAEKEKIYEEALAKYPQTAWLWGSAAHFLQFEKKDYSKLENYYTKVLKMGFDEAWFLNNYAIYLKLVKKDYPKAEEYFLKTISKYPDYAFAIGNYARFLNDIKQDYQNAEKYFLKALELDPNNANLNNSYATFLKKVKQDYSKAEDYYLKALALVPDGAILNGSYAIFLKEIKKNYVEADKYYQKALTSEPDNVYINAAYAGFLYVCKKKATEAEEYYLKALAKDAARASINGNYAQILLSEGRKKEADKYLNVAFKNVVGNDELLLELWFYRYAHYPEYREEAKTKIDAMLAQGIRSTGWDFTPNIARAIKDKHPEIKLLKQYAAKITAAKPQ